MIKKVVKKVVKRAQRTKKTIKKATAGVKMPQNKKKVSKATYDVVIIGGGPAGLMAACTAGLDSLKRNREGGGRILVIEKNDELGKKLLISGGGRCNLTNADPDHRNFVSKYGLTAQAGKKGSLLFSPFSVFGVQDTIKFFNNLGVKTKTEAGFRVFPESDDSAEVLEVLVNKAKELGVEFKLSAEVSSLTPSLDKEGARGRLKNQKRIESVNLVDGSKITAKKFILATGGMSHPETGSTGEGFKWLKEIGHKVAEANPSLVPVKISNPWVSELSGITLENVGISIWSSSNNQGYQKALRKNGRVLFTHTGLSGPTILNMSKSIGELLEYPPAEDGARPDDTNGRVRAGSDVLISLDFFPGVGLDEMHEMMLKTFESNLNKKIKNLLFKEVPTKIFELILRQLEIDPNWEINEVRREERLALIEKFKKFEMTVSGLLGYDKAIISSGGLDLNEVDFKTMGSKLYDNLYFAGDILDFDRPSGGFSLQLCWTTGFIAGKNTK